MRNCFVRAGKYITWHRYTLHEFKYDIMVTAVVTALYYELCIPDIFIKMQFAWLVSGQVKITDLISSSQRFYCPIYCLICGRTINLNFSCKLVTYGVNVDVVGLTLAPKIMEFL